MLANRQRDCRSVPAKPNAVLTTIVAASLLSAGVGVTASFTGAVTPAAAAASRQGSSTGLDAKTLRMINLGDWDGATTRLESLTAGESAPSGLDGWLAFGYLFQGKCKECRAVADRVAGYKTAEGDQAAAQIVQSFRLICDGKLDDAESALKKPAEEKPDDVLVNFALAAVSGKRSQAATAVRYCQKVVRLAPDFAWGYRTLGFIEDRWFKDPAKAESDYLKALVIEPNFQEARELLVDVRLLRNDFDGAIDAAQAGIKANPKDARNYYRLAQIYTQQWRLREALTQLQRAIAIDPGEAKYHRVRATIFRYQGQIGEALKEQQVAVDLGKDKGFELVELASLNMVAGNTNRAADNLREALKLDPDNAAAHQRLVQLLMQERRYDDLVEEFRRAVDRRPKDAELHLGLARALRLDGKLDDAIGEFKNSANLDPKNPLPHRELGTLFIERKDYNGAAKEYTRALNINPSSVEDLVSLGYCYAQNEDYLQAEAAMVTAIALQQLSGPSGGGPVSHLDLMRSLAALLLEEGRYADACSQLEAVSAASKAAASNPYDQFLLAEAKALRDRTASAAKALIEAFDKMPGDRKKQQSYAVVDSLLKIEKADMALDLMSTLQEQQPKAEKPDVQWLIDGSRARQLKGDLARAYDLASQAVAIKSGDTDKDSDAHWQLGLVLMTKGDATGAEGEIRKAIAINPKSYAAWESLGRIFLKKKDPQQALAQGKRALEINPYYAPAYMLVGDAFSFQGKWKEASESYKKATELYPGLLDAHKALLDSYKQLSLKDEARKEQEQISQIEKRQ